MNDKIIPNAQLALELLKQHILISKNYGGESSLYTKASNKQILVINQNKKYYITEEQFYNDFNLSIFYLYKHLSEVEIDQEFRKLRQ